MSLAKRRAEPQPVLVVDDDDDVLTLAREALHAGGIGPVTTLRDGGGVASYLAEQPCRLVLLDLGLPGEDGRELLTSIAHSHPDLSVVVVSGRDEVATAVSCLHRGAYDYLVKPLPPQRLIEVARKALGAQRLRASPKVASTLWTPGDHAEAFAEILTVSPAMRDIFAYLASIAGTGEPVLITGETGTGKDLIARALHRLSRVPGEYVAVNVGGFDDAMFSDALFGHRKGAFTGATDIRHGLVQRASTGTLFLDEIGDLSLVSQVKLLRLLQEGEYFPLGSDAHTHSTARVLVATSQDLRVLEAQGRFRKDLFYRLRTHHLHLPPLRDRREDIPVLAAHFLEEAVTRVGSESLTIPPDLMDLIQTYPFPGNVRELRSLVYDSVVRSRQGRICGDPFRRAHLESTTAPPGSPPITFGRSLPTLHQARDALVAEALKRAGGNQALAARHLGITRQGLNKRLHADSRSDDESELGQP